MVDNRLNIDNPKLTSDQLAALLEFQVRISNLENEVSIVARTLRANKLESERSLKERMYQENLLSDVNSKVNIAATNLQELQETITVKTSELNILIEKIKTLNLEQENKNISLREKEEKIAVKEQQLIEKENSLRKISQALNIEKAEHVAKVIKLKEATSGL